MLKKHAISNNIVTVLKAHGKGALADFTCNCKMRSVVVLDRVMSFLRLKDTTYSCKRFLHCNGVKLEEAEDFKCVFVV